MRPVEREGEEKLEMEVSTICRIQRGGEEEEEEEEEEEKEEENEGELEEGEEEGEEDELYRFELLRGGE